MNRHVPLFLLLLVLPSIVSAQSNTRYELYVNGGISVPYYPRYLQDNWRWGLNAGIGVGYHLLPQLVIDGSVDFHSFRFDDAGYYRKLGETGFITSVDGKLSSVSSLSTTIRYFLDLSSDGTFLFLIGGGGIQRLHIGEIKRMDQDLEAGLVKEEFFPASTNNGFQLQLGVGLDLVASEERSYYVEARYVIGFLPDYNSHFLPVKVGIRQRIL